MRRSIPLAVRYEVLCRQADPAMVEKINRAGGPVKLRYSKVLAIATCRLTGERLIEHRCEFDHITPVELGGSNEADNIQALIPRAHRMKTDADIARIAKCRRQAGLTGQRARREKNGPRLKGPKLGEVYRRAKEFKRRGGEE